MKDVVANNFECNLHMCAYGLRHPKTKLPLKKATRLYVSSSRVAELLAKRCPGEHQHGKIAGSGTMLHRGKRMMVSAWCGGYHKQFAQAFLQAWEKAWAEEELHDALATGQSSKRARRTRFEQQLLDDVPRQTRTKRASHRTQP